MRRRLRPDRVLLAIDHATNATRPRNAFWRQKVTRFFFEITPLGPHMQCSLAFDGLDGNQRSRPLRTTDPSRFPFPVPYIHAQAVLPYLSSHSNT
jgi:hypothetical protein